MFEDKIEEIMMQKGITKADFSRKMGVKRQNVNTLLKTENINKLMLIADVLGCEVSNFIKDHNQDMQPAVNGYIEVDGVVHTIRSVNDFFKVQTIIEKSCPSVK